MAEKYIAGVTDKHKPLIVALNLRVRDNLGFYDPVTCTQLSVANPRSRDLNRELINHTTGEKVKMDLSGRIEQGIRSGVLIVEQGEHIDKDGRKWVATAYSPIEQEITNPKYEIEWKKMVQQVHISKATKNAKNAKAVG